MRSAIARAAPGLLFIALVLAVWSDPVFLRRNFGGRDLLGYNLPVEDAIHDAWARGRLPVWIDEISGGRPLAANPNSGVLYPVRPLLALLPFPMAMRLFPVIHWVIAGLGAMTLARLTGLSRGSGWIAAVSYTFCGVGVSEVVYTNYQPGMALLPWVVWAGARADGRSSARMLVLAALLGVDLYAGDVFTTGLAVAGVLLWIVLEQERGQRGRAIQQLAVAVALAGLLAAPQLLASALWVPLTNRAVLGMKVGEVVGMSLSPWRLLELIVPFPFGASWALESGVVWGTPVFRGRLVGFFCSLYAGGLAAIGIGLLWKARERGARFARAFLALGFLLSALPSFVPAAWETWRAPLALRYPEKFAVAIAVAQSFGAGLAFEARRRRGGSIRAILAVGALLAVLAGASSLWPAAAGRAAVSAVGAAGALAPIAAEQLPGALAEAGLLWMGTVVALDWLRRPGRRSTASALCLLTLLPIAANRRIARRFDEDALLKPTAFARFVRRRDPEGAYRTLGYAMAPADLALLAAGDPAMIDFDRRSWLFFTPRLWRRGLVFNGDADHGDLSRTESLRQVFNMAALYKDSSPFFGAASLRFGIRARGQPAFDGYKRVGGDALQDWDEHERPFPDVRLLTRWRESASASEALRAIPRLAPGEIVLETGSNGAGVAREGSVRIVERSPERLVVATSSADASWLFVVRGFWDYRDVAVDGRRAETVPAQLAFSAVPVPAGSHRIEWREELPGLRLSMWGPVLALLFGAFLHVRERNAGAVLEG